MSIFDLPDIVMDVEDSKNLTAQQKKKLAKTYYHQDISHIEDDLDLLKVFAKALKEDMKENPDRSIPTSVLKVLYKNGIHL